MSSNEQSKGLNKEGGEKYTLFQQERKRDDTFSKKINTKLITRMVKLMVTRVWVWNAHSEWMMKSTQQNLGSRRALESQPLALGIMTTPSLCWMQLLLGIRMVCLLTMIPGEVLSYFGGKAKEIVKVHWSYSPQLEHHSFCLQHYFAFLNTC